MGISADLFDKHDVVSAEAAAAMAEGVRERLKADIGISTTGLAEKEIASGRLSQVWLAYADKEGTSTRHVDLYHGRNVNRERAANQAIIFALEKLAGR